MREITHEQWKAEAMERFGADPLKWRFVCPICKVETSVDEWKKAGAPEGAVAFSCIGRYTKGEGTMNQKTPKRPCDYTGGGLFRLNPVKVNFSDGKDMTAFEFAPVSSAETPEVKA